MKKILIGSGVLLILGVVGVIGFSTVRANNMAQTEKTELPSSKSSSKPMYDKNAGEIIRYFNSAHKVLGENQDITITSWNVELENGKPIAKISFDFENKSNKKVNLEGFAQSRINLGVMTDNKTYKKVNFDSTALSGEIISEKGKASGTLTVDLSDTVEVQSLVFGVSREQDKPMRSGITLNFN